jgi:N-acetyltransferase
VCAWQSTGFHAARLGPRIAQYARHGMGDTHAVSTDGSQSEAVCGEIVRFVSKDRWPPTLGDGCENCARIVAGKPALPSPTVDRPAPPRRSTGFAPELGNAELRGTSVRLEPLRSGQAAELLAAANEDRSSFVYVDVPSDLAGMLSYIERLGSERAAGKGLSFAVCDLRTGRLVGVTRYLNVEWWPESSGSDLARTPSFVEVGGTWLAASAQRTHVNTESKILMFGYAFEQLGVGRISLHTDEADERARVSVLRLGAWFEGVRRGHAIGVDGTMRNAAYFSITAVEWPAVKAVLRRRLERAGDAERDDF